MVRISEGTRKLIEKYQKTEKQKDFQYDFFVDQSKYEKWEDVEIGKKGFEERTFEVKREDIQAYVESTQEENIPEDGIHSVRRCLCLEKN